MDSTKCARLGVALLPCREEGRFLGSLTDVRILIVKRRSEDFIAPGSCGEFRQNLQESQANRFVSPRPLVAETIPERVPRAGADNPRKAQECPRTISCHGEEEILEKIFATGLSRGGVEQCTHGFFVIDFDETSEPGKVALPLPKERLDNFFQRTFQEPLGNLADDSVGTEKVLGFLLTLHGNTEFDLLKGVDLPQNRARQESLFVSLERDPGAPQSLPDESLLERAAGCRKGDEFIHGIRQGLVSAEMLSSALRQRKKKVRSALDFRGTKPLAEVALVYLMHSWPTASWGKDFPAHKKTKARASAGASIPLCLQCSRTFLLLGSSAMRKISTANV